MSNYEINDIQKQIDALKAKKEKLEIERNKIVRPIEICDIADILHKKLCTYNHIDGCDWSYGSWTDNNLGYSRQKYFGKAKEVIKYSNKNRISVKQIIDIFVMITKS